MTEEKHMREAIELSHRNILKGAGGPFAAVIVRNGAVVARGTNLVTSTNDPTAHAEIVAIRAACRSLKTFQLSDCEIYTTCEPCPMCLGAVYWARLKAVYYANTRYDAAKIGFDDDFLYHEFTVPLADRKIMFTQMMRHEAIQVFQEWTLMENKIRY